MMNQWKKPNKSILKLPFINDAMAARVSRRVRQCSPDVRLVFTSGPSLKRRLVRSSFGTRMCPRDVQRAKVERSPGRPMVCGALLFPILHCTFCLTPASMNTRVLNSSLGYSTYFAVLVRFTLPVFIIIIIIIIDNTSWHEKKISQYGRCGC